SWQRRRHGFPRASACRMTSVSRSSTKLTSNALFMFMANDPPFEAVRHALHAPCRDELRRAPPAAVVQRAGMRLAAPRPASEAGSRRLARHGDTVRAASHGVIPPPRALQSGTELRGQRSARVSEWRVSETCERGRSRPSRPRHGAYFPVYSATVRGRLFMFTAHSYVGPAVALISLGVALAVLVVSYRACREHAPRWHRARSDGEGCRDFRRSARRTERTVGQADARRARRVLRDPKVAAGLAKEFSVRPGRP